MVRNGRKNEEKRVKGDVENNIFVIFGKKRGCSSYL